MFIVSKRFAALLVLAQADFASEVGGPSALLEIFNKYCGRSERGICAFWRGFGE